MTDSGDAAALAAAYERALSAEPDAIAAYARAVHRAGPDAAGEHDAHAARLLNEALTTDPTPDLLVIAAWMLAAGRGYAPDPDRARKMLDAAAAQGSADAHFELYVYDLEGIAGEQSQKRAIAHLRAAAQRGSIRAMANLGGLHATGTGVRRDEARSVSWYRMAADGGDARSARNLATMFRDGVGAPKDPVLASHYAALAAQHGA